MLGLFFSPNYGSGQVCAIERKKTGLLLNLTQHDKSVLSKPHIQNRSTHLSTDVAWREKKSKHFVFYKYFSLALGLLKSKISEKINQLFLNKLDFKLFHYKARVQPVSKITTIATRNRC